MSLAKQRWRLLTEVLLNKQCKLPENNEVSVRRFHSFGLLKVIPDDSNKEDSNGVWLLYSWLQFPNIMSKLRHLHGTVDAEILFGFNNTGNVCVWPAEEILAYYLLKHPELCRNKRVCELGGGMTCLAGVMVSLGIEAKQVLLTDGNERSVQNLSEIVKANKAQFKSLHTSERCLQWNQWNQLGDLRESFDMVICADCLFFDDCREDLALIIRELLTSQGEALILAPQRSGTFQKFESIAKQMFENVERQTNYDADVTRIHKMLLENGNNGFDENLHYPWLLKIANKLPQSS